MHNDPDPPQRLDVHFHFDRIDLNVTLPHHDRDAEILAKLDKLAKSITQLKETVIMNQTELKERLDAAAASATAEAAKAEKIGNETRTLLLRITDLLAQLAAGEVSPEVQAAMDALDAQQAIVNTTLGTVDDLVEDPAP